MIASKINKSDQQLSAYNVEDEQYRVNHQAAVDFLKKNGYAKSNNVFGFDKTLYSNTYSYQFPTIGYNKNEFIHSILVLISPESNYKEQNSKITIEAQFYLN